LLKKRYENIVKSANQYKIGQKMPNVSFAYKSICQGFGLIFLSFFFLNNVYNGLKLPNTSFCLYAIVVNPYILELGS
jgi:hypothetical protein